MNFLCLYILEDQKVQKHRLVLKTTVQQSVRTSRDIFESKKSNISEDSKLLPDFKP